MLMFSVSHLKLVRTSVPFLNPLHHTKHLAQPQSSNFSILLSLPLLYKLTLPQPIDKTSMAHFFYFWPLAIDQTLSAHRHIYILVNITGLQPIIVETTTCGDELRTDLTAMEHQMATLGAENIACVLTTTSCFAPRASDSVEQVAVLCSRYNIPHIINNAYGLQSSRCMHLIQEAAR